MRGEVREGRLREEETKERKRLYIPVLAVFPRYVAEDGVVA